MTAEVVGAQSSQSAGVAGEVVAEDDASHARLAGPALAHQQDLLLLDLLEQGGLVGLRLVSVVLHGGEAAGGGPGAGVMIRHGDGDGGGGGGGGGGGAETRDGDGGMVAAFDGGWRCRFDGRWRVQRC